MTMVSPSGPACTGQPTSVFFPEEGESSTPAKYLCRRCPVRELCLTWALDTDQQHGILGGYDPDERRRIRRNRHHVIVSPSPLRAVR